MPGRRTEAARSRTTLGTRLSSRSAKIRRLSSLPNPRLTHFGVSRPGSGTHNRHNIPQSALSQMMITNKYNIIADRASLFPTEHSSKFLQKFWLRLVAEDDAEE